MDAEGDGDRGVAEAVDRQRGAAVLGPRRPSLLRTGSVQPGAVVVAGLGQLRGAGGRQPGRTCRPDGAQRCVGCSERVGANTRGSSRFCDARDVARRSSDAERVRLVATDAHPTWLRRVRAATESIVVFAPSLDALVPRLLLHSSLDTDGIAVVTDLSPATNPLSYSKHLAAIDELLGRGVRVLDLPGLSSHIVWTDGVDVCLGSQQLTGSGRRGRVTSALSDGPLETFGLVSVLDDWQNEADPIDPALIRHLASRLGPERDGVSDAIAALVGAAHDATEEYEAERRRREAERLARLRSSSTIRLASGTAFAAMGTTGGWNSYESLLVDSGHDLTNWTVRSGGSTRRVELARLFMCPILMADTGRMGFARVGRTRITYVRDAVDWTDSMTLDGEPVSVSVSFPSDRARVRNVRFELQARRSRHVARVEALFSGDAFEVVRYTRVAIGRPSEDYRKFEATVRECFEDPTERGQLFARYLKRFTYKHLGVWNHNAGEYFKWGRRYRLSVIEHAKTPVLLVTPV